MRTIVRALRPLHWIKSGFCLAALFLSGQFLNLGAWAAVLPLVLAMSLLSSAGYLWNDICNLQEDRQHPRKKKRPIAAGLMSVRQASVLAMILLGIGGSILFGFYGVGWVSGLGVAYLGISAAYNLVLRGLPLVDVLVLSLGFVVRVTAGAFSLGLKPTAWLILCTYTISLLLGFGKRKGELSLLKNRVTEIGETRDSLRGYTMMLLDASVGMSAVLAVGSYLGFALVRADPWISLSVLPVILGVSEYLRWASRSDQVELPEKLLGRSRVLLFAVLTWAALIVVAGLAE